MISNAATIETEHGALARDLLRRAVFAFATVPTDEREPAFVAIDAFLAAPGPATYLAAIRILADSRRKSALRQVRAAQAGHALARGLEAVRRELGSSTAETLAAVPADERTGLRLRALAYLSAAHRELAERVAGSAELLRRQLGLGKDLPPEKAPPRRRPIVKRDRRASLRRRTSSPK